MLESRNSTSWVVIPAYNEASVIASTIQEVLKGFQHVVVVDDCSSDDTARIAVAAGASVCRHPVNLGQGAALQTGIDYAIANGADNVVTFDADGQHRLADALTMIDVITTSGVDVVLGSRFLGADAVGMAKSKRLLLRAATLFTRVTTGLNVTDTHNGLRCLSGKAARKLRIRHNKMAHASEILAQIGELGLKYKEVPCTIIYTDYSRTKGQKMSGAFKILYDLAVGRLSR